MRLQMRTVRTILLCAFLLHGGAADRSAAAQQPGSSSRTAVTTVIVVRHAEKVDDSRDPALSPAGTARAAALAAALADAGVQAIYTTQYRRTRDTAAPLAERLGLTATVIEAGGAADAHARAFAERVLATDAGRTVLIVGHSNTVPAIVRALGGPDVGAIADDEYGNLFVVQIGPAGTRLIRSRY